MGYITCLIGKSMSVEVRLAAKEDLEDVELIARSLHSETVFRAIPFSSTKFQKLFAKPIDMPSIYMGFVVLCNKRVSGFCYGYVGDYYIGDKARVLTIHTFAISKDIRSTFIAGKASTALLNATISWGKAHNADFLISQVTAGIELGNANRFFVKKGAVTLGGNYALVL